MVSGRREFGERLKRQRERRGITLESISQSSKVPVWLFAGLESGDCSRWPASVYARAYVRSYATAIGLNPEETVEEFSVAFGLKPEGAEADSAAAGRAAGSLRLSLVEESPMSTAQLGRRAAFAATELLLGLLIAAVAHVGLQAGTWLTVAGVLGYFVIGRVVTDEPLLYWMYRRTRLRAASVRTRQVPARSSSEVAPVGDAASTAA